MAHLEAVIDDFDTDVVGVMVDLSEFGLGIITLSDSGSNGDEVIQDSVWTARINHDGLEFGNLSVPIKMDDIWTDVQTTAYVEISNAAPRITSRVYSPDFAYRGNLFLQASRWKMDMGGIGSNRFTSAGGDLTPLTLDSNTNRWVGQFILPESLAPDCVRFQFR